MGIFGEEDFIKIQGDEAFCFFCVLLVWAVIKILMYMVILGTRRLGTNIPINPLIVRLLPGSPICAWL